MYIRSPRLIIFLWSVATLLIPATSQAQVVQQAIGGVLIDAHGVLIHPTQLDRQRFVEHMQQNLAVVPADLHDKTEMRKISLKGLCERLAALGKGEPIPDEIKYLGGLQRAAYIFVYPEQHDIVLAGPGEAWQVSPTGAVVGATTGKPVILLDDLIVALKASSSAREGISCSIDPTAEGRQSLRAYYKQFKRFSPNLLAGAEQAMGQQHITLKGVPGNSHFARILVASDYRMKRFAMHLEQAPVKGLPSYLDLVKKHRGRSMSKTPRWWLACNYEPIQRSQDALAWHIQGLGVKTMTEDQVVTGDGQVKQTGQANMIAQEWADMMTAAYEDLCRNDPVFGQLRNVMDLSILAAIIDREQLTEVAQCDLSYLYSEHSQQHVNKWSVPKTVDTSCSFIKSGRSFVITASGGVLLDPWYFATRTKLSTDVSKQRLDSAPSENKSWRWN